MSSLVTTFENWEEFSILGLPRLSICSSNYSKTNTVHLQSSNYCPTQRTTLLLCKSSCVKILYGRQIFAQSDWRMERMQLACEKQLLWSKIFFGSDFKMWAQTTDFRKIFVGLNKNIVSSISLFESVENTENGPEKTILTRNAPCPLLSYMWLQCRCS